MRPLRIVRMSLVAAMTFSCASGGQSSAPESPAPKASKPAKRRLPKGVGPRGAIRPSKALGQEELEAAKKLARDGNIDDAVTKAKEVIGMNPQLQDAYLLVGSICTIKGDPACAHEIYDQGLQALPDSEDLHHASGMLFLEEGRIEDAVKDLEKAHGITQGKNAEIAADLAYAYIFVKRVDESVMLAKSARQIAPKSFAAAYTHGEALLAKKQPGEAAEAFRAALKITPKDPSAERKLAVALSRSGKNKEALEIYDRLIAANAKDPRLLAAKAGLQLEQGDKKGAVKTMKAAVRLAPKVPKLWELLLHTQEQAGDKRGAKKTRKKLKSLERK